MPPASPDQREFLKTVGDQIKEADGDVVSLQEVPSKAALETLISQEGLAEKYPYRRFFQTNDAGGNHLATLSKVPFEESKGNTQKRFKIDGSREPGYLSRDITESKVKLGGYPFRVYNSHLKANPQMRRDDPDFARQKTFADNLRYGEVRALKDIIKDNVKKMPSERYVVTMDANATPTDGAVQALQKGFAPMFDPIGDKPGFDTHPSSHRRLDYVLLSDNLASSYVPGSAEVLKSSPYRRGPDHNPQVVMVELPDLPQV